MQELTIMGFALLCIAAALWVPQFRLRRALLQPLPKKQRAALLRNVSLYRKLPPPLQQQLIRLVKQFLHQKKFVGCGGLRITDEIRVTIAAQACLLLLNSAPGKERVFPWLDMVLVYPTLFVAPHTEREAGGVVTQAQRPLAGESWGDGRVILAWDHALEGGQSFGDGHNVVLHEFAHQLDSESGAPNGAPPLPGSVAARWADVMAREYERLRREEAEREDGAVMDFYGATNPAEFFAVATETFFGKPEQMAERHPELYAELNGYYRVDPRQWQ